MALHGEGGMEEPVEEPEDFRQGDVRISPAIEMPDAGPGVETPAEPLLLPWDRFSAWLHCICVVGFDLELGQAVEVKRPLAC